MGFHEQIFRLLSIAVAGIIVSSAIGFVESRRADSQAQGFLHDLEAVEEVNELNSEDGTSFTLRERAPLKNDESLLMKASDRLSKKAK